MSDSSEVEDVNNTPPDILKQVNITVQSLSPLNSKEKYRKEHLHFNGPKKSIFMLTQRRLFWRVGTPV